MRNWAAYEKSLRRRGDLTIWFDESAIGAWNARPTGHPGGQRRYSTRCGAPGDPDGPDPAHGVPSRPQADRRLRSLADRLDGPRARDDDPVRMDHTTLSRRSGALEVQRHVNQHRGPIHLVIDSTGLKIVGDGEWHAYKHRTSNKRRSWRKLHLAVRSDGFVEASVLTESAADDAVVGEALIDGLEVPVASFRGDGAYDTRAFYAALGRVGTSDIDIVIPPGRRAAPSRAATGTWRQRNEAIVRIDQVGRRQWRKEAGAHQQARGPSRPAGTVSTATSRSLATTCVREHPTDRGRRR